MTFEPIAIVGQACVLPDAFTPAELWDLIAAGRSVIAGPPDGLWRVAPERVIGTGPDRTVTDRGGYVRGFAERFDATGFALPADEVRALDRRAQWLLHAAREALRSVAAPRGALGAIVGDLGYPSLRQAQFAEAVWSGDSRPDAGSRFSSPGHALARALRLEAGAFALDAACASSLYAIRLACDALHDRRAGAMIAGGVNAADDLLVHIGFTALGALSPTGQSRPFHREADGLVPAEGAAVVVLKRLADAVADGDRIIGVIRAVGLSNDGRGHGLLVPSAPGQERAMRAAYAQAGLAPADVQLVECHATGTTVGDATEIGSMRAVFAGCRDLPVGSLKSNLGHLITAAGAAGLLKVLGAFAARVLPPMRAPGRPIDASPFRLVAAPEAWEARGPRRAAVSGFGFGGNNAHLIVEEWQPGAPVSVAVSRPRRDLAVVGLGALPDAAALAATLFSGRGAQRLDEIAVPLARLRFPPADLKRALPQQLAILAAAEEAVADSGALPTERTGVFIGVSSDDEAARYCAHWRRADLDGIAPTLDNAAVIGTMPNIPANRLSSHLDLEGPGFTVAADELSGVRALEIAARALRHGELDAALVGAVDLCCEPVHEAAARAVLGPERQPPGDAAVALVLVRLDDARRDGRTVYAVLPDDDEDGERFDHDPTPQLGHAHAAAGLLRVVAAALACHHRALPGPARPWLPGPSPRRVAVAGAALGGQRATVRVACDDTRPGAPLVLDAAPRVQLFSGADRRAVHDALLAGRESDVGPARLALVADDRGRAARLAAARAFLDSDGDAAPEGVHYHDAPVGGELGFVFTMAAAAYPGMGRELLLALPELADRVAPRFRSMRAAASWRDGDLHGQLLAYSLVTQAHAELSRGLLGLRPSAAIGLCTGESAALFGLGAWDDMDGMFQAIVDSGLYGRELSGDFTAVLRAWRRAGIAEEPRWATWRVGHPVDAVRAALAGEPLAHLAIIHAPADCLLVGHAPAVERVVARLGAGSARALGAGMAIHCPEVREFAAGWRAVHHRPTRPVPGVRFYAHATGTHYQPDPDSAADAILGQALATIDFRQVIENAWRDGVRVFLEHGPRDLCTGWIREILGTRPHVAVALDAAGRAPLVQALDAAAALAAAGVAVDLESLRARLAPHPPRVAARGPTLRVPAHLPAPVPAAEVMAPPLLAAEAMAPAPSLPPPDAVGVEPAPPRPRPLPPPAAIGVEPAPPRPRPAPPLPPPAAIGVEPAPPRPRPASPQAAMFAAVAESQRRFVALQARVHAEFLAGRARALALGPGPAPVDPASAPPRPAPAPPQPAPAPRPAPAFPRLPLARADLERLASGTISSVLGPRFAVQDGYRRQVRMPDPPLLLADRVTELAGEPGSMGLGTIVTETDVAADAWYLHHGVMPTGILIESGQADLLLISWLGADLENRGERVYRLLGCDVTFHGGAARPGETLRYEIHVDGHARQGDVRLFFFHYDGSVGGARRLSVRGGQAGFFTDAELAGSAGILWDAREQTPAPARLDPPRCLTTRRALAPADLTAFADGRTADCFGPGFELAETHVRTPRIQGGRMQLLHEVNELDASGGPWRRGYLRATRRIAPDDWFFAGHFKDDPCMPGTLMFEGCLQAMAVYLAGLGFTLDRDGWRFEPVPDESYRLRCRGQVIPGARELVTEVFVSELHDGPLPTLYADLLCTVDGLKAFHCRRMGLRLVPDWPLTTFTGKLPAERRLLASAWGKPSDAFGDMGRIFDGPRRPPRLPGPPYLFITRIVRVDDDLTAVAPGASIEVEYDVPPDAWYFDENDGVMPFSVLLEAALQPCGWLVAGCAVGPEDVRFRNLDGKGTLAGAVRRDAGTLRTRARLTSLSRSSGMTLVSLAVECTVGGQVVFKTDTVFGFFPPEALARQAALPAGPDERALLDAPAEGGLDLDGLRPTDARLHLIDRVTGYWPRGGRAGLGRLRAEKDIRPSDWFFKAHFFQDPVQPGSLGLEALLQLLELHMRARGLVGPFVPTGAATWKYRGQVLPTSRLVTLTLDVIAEGPDHAVADASLWCDGVRIYHAPSLGLRAVGGADVVLDPARDRWLADHRPTYTLPAMAMTEILDRMAAAALARSPGRRVVAVRVQALDWVIVDGPTPVRFASRVLESGETEVDLFVRGQRAATGRVLLGEELAPPPPPPAPLDDAAPVPDPYASGELFHGPAFQLVQSLVRGAGGASSIASAESGVPVGVLNPGLLDAALHGIPHDAPAAWCPEAPADHVIFPAELEVTVHGPTPAAGTVRCEARFEGLVERRFVTRIAVVADGRVWATLRLTSAFVPRPRLAVDRVARRRFTVDRAPVAGTALSRLDDDATRLPLAELRAARWFPGFVESVYDVGGDLDAMARAIAIKDHVARRAGAHPATVAVAPETDEAVCPTTPLTRYPIRATRAGLVVEVRDAGPPTLDLEPVRRYWRRETGLDGWAGEVLHIAAIRRFVRQVRVADPPAFAAVAGRPVLYLANHQVAVESLVFVTLVSALAGMGTAALAKAEHAESWVGQLESLQRRYPGAQLRPNMIFFDRKDPAQLLRILAEIKSDLGRSLLVHVEGTRALACRHPVTRVSGALLDLAVQAELPIVPVRFAGGLPVAPVPERLDFPVGHGALNIHIGRPIAAAAIAGLPLAERQRVVLAALNDGVADEEPAAPDPAFGRAVAAIRARDGVSEPQAVLGALLDEAGGLPSGGDHRWQAELAAWLGRKA
jgi:acyl transferase domain-containing protein/3-hydroxymyristoyl/3-hydroxydecanoyl-(acyl carrier protein) dehydratase/1-acyl-sn-glycerol-3-phosphate acyltransferase